MKHFISLLIINIFFLPSVWAKESEKVEKKIIIEHAEKLNFVDKNKERIINLEGKVKLINEKTTLCAEYVQFTPSSKMLTAQKEVFLEDEDQKVWGDELVLNTDTNQGHIKNIKSYQEPTFYQGNIAHIKNRNHYNIKDGCLTTCDLNCSHYTIKTKNIDLKIKDRVLAKHVFLRVGNIPVFYSPFYRRSLKDTHTHLSVKPGYSKSDGWTAKIKYNYHLNENNLGLLLLDYYELRGLGQGINHEYNLGEESKGRLNIYYIKEDKDLNSKAGKRWNLSNYYYYNFPKNLTLVTNINYVSDKSFNKNFSENINVLTNEVISDISLTKIVPAYCTARVTCKRYDVLDKDKNEIIKKEELLPGVAFNTKRLEIKKSKWFYEVATQFGRKYKDKYYHNFLEGKVDFLKDYSLEKYKIRRGISFSPSLGIAGNWRSKEDIYKDNSYYDADYYAKIVIPMGFYRGKIRINPQYNYKRSFKDLKTKESKVRLGYKHSIEKNIDLNLTLGYDYLKKEYDNLVTQLTAKNQDIKLSKNLELKTVSFSLNNSYNLEKQEIRSIDTYLNLSAERNSKKYCFYLGSNYIPDKVSQFKSKFSTDFIKYLQLNLGVWYDLKKQELQQGEIILKRDLHCFEWELCLQRYKIYESSPTKWDTRISYRLNLKDFKETKFSIFQDGNIGRFGFGDVFAY